MSGAIPAAVDGGFLLATVSVDDLERTVRSWRNVTGCEVVAEEPSAHDRRPHHSGYGIIGSPAVLLAAIAEGTSRVRIGCGISVLPFGNPVRIAEDYAMVDKLSGGRLNFGIGHGNQPMEYHMMRA